MSLNSVRDDAVHAFGDAGNFGGLATSRCDPVVAITSNQQRQDYELRARQRLTATRSSKARVRRSDRSSPEGSSGPHIP
jgi:hypothetical protein